MTIEVRFYSADDWPAVCSIYDRARLEELRHIVGFEGYLPLVETYEADGLFDGRVWVAESDHTVAGFAAVHTNELKWLYVDPDHHRRGIGSALTRHILGQAESPMTIKLIDGNESGHWFCKRMGFRHTKRERSRLRGNPDMEVLTHTFVWGGAR